MINALRQLLIAETLGMSGMGGINGHHITVMGFQPGPDLIHPTETLNMSLASQCRLLAGGWTPGGLSGGSHGSGMQSPRPITSRLVRQSNLFDNPAASVIRLMRPSG